MLVEATLNRLDWVVLLVYFVITFGIGVWASRRQKTEADYFMAGRSVHPLVAGISLFATLFSTVSFVAVPSEAYQHGVLLLLGSVGYALFTPVAVNAFLRFFYGRGESSTLYQYLEERFDWRARLLASTAFLIGRVFWAATACFAGAKLFDAMAGWNPTWTIVGMVVFTTLYTTIGGMRGVMLTDVMQTVMIFLGVAIIGAWLSSLIGYDYAAVWLFANEQGHGFGRVWDPEFYKLNLYDRYSFWQLLLIYSILRPLQDYGSDQMVVQRLLSAKSYQAAKRAAYIKTIMAVPLMATFYGLGLLLFYYYNKIAAPPEGMESDKVLAHFVVTTLPAPLPGLIAAAMLAALMSSISSVISSLATVSSIDILQRWGWNPSTDVEKLRAGKWLALLWGVIVFLIALLLGQEGKTVMNSIMEISQVILSLWGVLLVVVLSGVGTRWATANGAAAGLCVGMAVGIVVPYRFYFMTPGADRIGFLWLSVPGIVVTALVVCVVSVIEVQSRKNSPS